MSDDIMYRQSFSVESPPKYNDDEDYETSKPDKMTYGAEMGIGSEKSHHHHHHHHHKHKSDSSLGCICGFLTVVIVILLLLVSVKGYDNRSRATSKQQQVLYFYRPGCPHCDNFSPTWDSFVEKAKADSSLNSKFEFRKINCMDPQLGSLCIKEREFGMRGVPHVVLIDGNGKRKVFNDSRTVDKLLSFVRS